MKTSIDIRIVSRTSDYTAAQPLWQRITLLTILAYEAAGCLLGGALLISTPDGSSMQMPVEMLHGVFSSFMIPGIILFGLGVLNTWAFMNVLRRRSYDWFMSGLGMGGLLIWFIVEIIIIRELHWLHLMWGLPVLAGWIVTVPLIAMRHPTAAMHKGLLACGVLSSFWYIAINVIVPMLDDNYRIASTTVSELSAIGAPTRIPWVLLVTFYPLLFMAFGWGVISSARNNTKLRITGSLIILYCVSNLYWPPMHLRDVIASGGATLTDTLHITWAFVTLAFMSAMMIFGALAMSKRFRYFTIVIFAVFLTFGMLTSTESGAMSANLPTPHIGTWERVNIGAFMVWITVLAVTLLRREQVPVFRRQN